ncbi:unnamed protein product, partial [Ilex paraguariensis]
MGGWSITGGTVTNPGIGVTKVWQGHILCFLACASWQLFGIGCIGISKYFVMNACMVLEYGVRSLWTNGKSTICKSSVGVE